MMFCTNVLRNVLRHTAPVAIVDMAEASTIAVISKSTQAVVDVCAVSGNEVVNMDQKDMLVIDCNAEQSLYSQAARIINTSTAQQPDCVHKNITHSLLICLHLHLPTIQQNYRCVVCRKKIYPSQSFITMGDICINTQVNRSR